MTRLVDLELFVAHETDKAFLVKEDEGGDGVWIPKSQCEVHGGCGEVSDVTLPEWLAEERGFI
ncbi:hypothetical protein [Mameliella alba]|uniref:Uncharacterized protein n=1 Tax=Mameliella alba TaxID=561184 RepID=A0A0B3SKP5_9RHOB|nr:hypothetical protein [Mameliella alba]KHQ51124.1 hypothetical protein OA50_04495 [Mameliella alba]